MTLHAGPMTSDGGHLVAAALVRQRDRCLPNRKSRNYSRSHKRLRNCLADGAGNSLFYQI